MNTPRLTASELARVLEAIAKHKEAGVKFLAQFSAHVRDRFKSHIEICDSPQTQVVMNLYGTRILTRIEIAPADTRNITAFLRAYVVTKDGAIENLTSVGEQAEINGWADTIMAHQEGWFPAEFMNAILNALIWEPSRTFIP